jgi:hypothetical protein
VKNKYKDTIDQRMSPKSDATAQEIELFLAITTISEQSTYKQLRQYCKPREPL